ncbi:hypothetical protein ASG14_11480 [Pedobacter sp. Leaf194]|nr:hypothetical protein ASG14_11480 [Pedobacter sp. Leaf194]
MSFVKCDDIREETGLNEQASSLTIKKHSPCAEADSCSPLCVCSCCGQNFVFLLKSSGPNSFRLESAVQNEAQYLNFFVSGFSNTIWQPPKMNVYLFG